MFLKFTKSCLIFLVFNYLNLIHCNQEDLPQIHIDNEDFKGIIVGKKFQEEGVEYLGFRGIPYANPPINELRFKDPQNLDRFEGTIDATQDGHECWAITARNGSENCLNLNVYTKELKPSHPLPVLVLIHPGGLYLATAASYFMRPQHMMTQDWVVVTFNYRLGSLGFLNLGSAEIPGNAGFKDQVYALRWIQKYIAYFGGNPQDVTLMGYSAGGLSVQLHLLSPMSKDLFHKAILMSGALAPQTYLPQQQKYLAIRLAKNLKCHKFLNIKEEIPYGRENLFSDYADIPNEDIFECLNQYNGSVIAHKLRSMFDYPKDNPIFLWLPVIEKDFKKERFLNENPQVANKNILIGYTNGEFCSSAEYILASETRKQEFSREFRTLAPRIFLYERHPRRDQITEEIIRKYFNNSVEFSPKDYDALCDLFSDSILRFGAHKFAEIMSKTQSSVYFYEFSFLEDSGIKDPIFPEKKGNKNIFFL
ncbi:esterase FE4-like [Cochliomyia hominivorax]